MASTEISRKLSIHSRNQQQTTATLALIISSQAGGATVSGVYSQLSKPTDFLFFQHRSSVPQIKTLIAGESSAGGHQKKEASRCLHLLHRQIRSVPLDSNNSVSSERSSELSRLEGGGGCPPPHCQNHIQRPSSAIGPTDIATVDIASLLKRSDSNESPAPISLSPFDSPEQQQQQQQQQKQKQEQVQEQQQQQQEQPPPLQQPKQPRPPTALSPAQYYLQQQAAEYPVQPVSHSPQRTIQPLSSVSSTPSLASAQGSRSFLQRSQTERFAASGPATQTSFPPVSHPTASRLQATRSGPPRGVLGPSAAGVAKRSMPPYTIDSPAKKQSKWSAEEDTLIIELRGSGMKWEDISKRLPGRSAISCRLHYQNYLERRSEWDEEKKNKLARLYER